MSLTWHIVKKDLRALKWPLAFWVLLIAVKLGVGVVMLNADGTEGLEWFTRMDILSRVLAGLECVSFVLTAALIQGDPLVGTAAFWMTRPISGARLLRAKLLGLGLVFGLLPVLVTLPWWLGCGYGPGEIAWATAETVAIHAVVVLLALMWSTVTDGYARFLMWTIVTLFTVPTLIGAGITGLPLLLQTGKPAGNVMATRMILGYGLAGAGILAVMIHQYLTRRTRRSITLIAASAGLIVVVGVAWPWNLDIDGRINDFLVRRAVGEWPADAPAALKPTVTSAEISGPGRRNGTGGNLRLHFQVDGLAGSQALMYIGGECRLRWPEGKVEPLHARARRAGIIRFGNRVWRAAAQGVGTDPYAETFTTDVGLNPWVEARFKAEAPACTLTAHLRLLQFESATPIPLGPGANRATGDRPERIAHAEKDGEEYQVVFIRRLPSLWVDNARSGWLVPAGPVVQYFLANKARDFVHPGRSIEHRETRIGTVGVSWQTIAYHASAKAGGARPSLEAMNALDDAELIKVTFREQARFSQEVAADPLQAERTSP